MRYPTPAKWRVKVLRTKDGDTIETYTDCGGPNEKRETWAVRLKDVHAPEIGQLGYEEVRAFVANWVAENGDGSEWPFLLETFRTPISDKDVLTLSRYVGVLTSATGKNLNKDTEDFRIANGYPPGN